VHVPPEHSSTASWWSTNYSLFFRHTTQIFTLHNRATKHIHTSEGGQDKTHSKSSAAAHTNNLLCGACMSYLPMVAFTTQPEPQNPLKLQSTASLTHSGSVYFSTAAPALWTHSLQHYKSLCTLQIWISARLSPTRTSWDFVRILLTTEPNQVQQITHNYITSMCSPYQAKCLPSVIRLPH